MHFFYVCRHYYLGVTTVTETTLFKVHCIEIVQCVLDVSVARVVNQ